MNKRLRKTLTVLATIVAAVFGIIATIPALTQDAFADAAAETKVLQVALLNGLKTCYNNTYMKKSIEGVNFTSAASLITSAGSKDGIVRVPNMVGNTLNDADVSCEQLFDGYNKNKTSNSIKGLVSIFGKNPKLTDLGYSLGQSAGSSSASQNCLWYTYSYNNSGISTPGTTERICFQVTNDTVQDLTNMNYVFVSKDADNSIGYGGATGPISLSYVPGNGAGEVQLYSPNMVTNMPTQLLSNGNPTWSSITSTMSSYATQIDNFYVQDPTSVSGGYNPYSGAGLKTSVSGGEVYETYNRDADGAVKALRYFTGDPSATWTSSVATFDSLDVYTMYSSYFNQTVQKYPNVLSRVPDDQCTTDNTYTYALYNNGKWCEVKGVEGITETFNGVNMSGDHWTGPLVPMSFSDIVKALGRLNYAYIESQGGTVGGLSGVTIENGVNGGQPQTGSNPSAGTFDGCFNNGGALAWIICPVLRIAGDAMDGIYQSIADNYLTIKSTTMTSDALRGVWSKFQGYANIIFAILLVFVILSQVTGIGLSNYGIKKVLPRLIITIVLVNLSFLICSVAVDLSNILGTSLNDLFTKWDVGNYAASNLNAGTMISNTVESLFSVGAVTGVTILGIKIAAASGALEGIILTLLLTVVVALVSIIFFYIILGVRQAAVILLVAVSPVAIVCYALPNTQKFFSRWLKIFSSLLLVFPICGLLMGGSNFASRLLLEAAGSEVSFMYFLVAMLLSVVPLFFVPTVLKSSMSAMGNLGMKLSNMGTRLGNWSSRTIRGTRAFQERQQEATRNSNMTRNSRIMNKTKLSDADKTRLKTLRDKRASGATLTSDERRDLSRLSSREYRYARASAARERLVAEDAMAEVTSMREPLEHGSARYEKMIAGATREQRNKDDAGQVALYEEGKVTAFDGSGNVVKADSLADLKSEHLALLQHVADHPEDEAAASKLRAVQTLLGRTGPKGFDAMEDNIGNLMANHGQFDNTNSQGIRLATAHLTRNFAGQIKANSRTFDKMLMDFNSDNFAQQSSFSQQTFTDGLGDSQTKFLSSHYSAKGAQSIKADNVNDLGDTYYDNLLHATINGHLKGKDLEQVLNVFNEAETAADAGKLTLKGEVRRRIKAIRDVAYASSNGSASGGRSEGSLMIGSASPAGIDSIVKQITDVNDWNHMTASERKQYSALVNNITESLEKDAHTVEDVRQLQQALDIANGKGILTSHINPTAPVAKRVSTADLHTFKVPRGSKQRVTLPTGWTKTPGGRWYNGSTPLTAEEVAKAEKILEHNASIDIDEGKV